MNNVVLKLLMQRVYYYKFKDLVKESLPASVGKLVDWFGWFFKKYPDKDIVDLGILRLAMFQNITPEAKASIEQVLTLLDKDVPPDIMYSMLQGLEETATVSNVTKTILEYEQGKITDVLQTLSEILDKSQVVQEHKELEINNLVLELNQDNGYRFDMFPMLGEALRGTLPPDNIAVAAYTDRGKTSAICRIIESFMHQSFAFKEERCILMLINEGTAERIMPRLVQTILNTTQEQVLEWAKDGSLEDRYYKVLKNKHKIVLLNIHGKNLLDVEGLIKKHKPFLVITDMTERIEGYAELPQHRAAEAKWDKMRQLAAIHQFIHIGTCQVSFEGADLLYPPLSALKDSKVGIQNTLDLAIYIGGYLNPVGEDENLRGISTPKNKLQKQGYPRIIRVNTIFDGVNNKWM